MRFRISFNLFFIISSIFFCFSQNEKKIDSSLIKTTKEDLGNNIEIIDSIVPELNFDFYNYKTLIKNHDSIIHVSDIIDTKKNKVVIKTHFKNYYLGYIFLISSIVIVLYILYVKLKFNNRFLHEISEEKQSEKLILKDNPEKILSIDSNRRYKSQQEIFKITNDAIKKSILNNSLNDIEIKKICNNNEDRWVTLSHSSIGKNHRNANPQIPCQDNYHYESINNTWQLSIVCDGAGSSSMSHFGSEVLSKTIVPKILFDEVNSLDWFINGEIPSENSWSEIGINILKRTYSDLLSWIKQRNNKTGTNHSIKEYASTVIIALYNSTGILVLNIGDGRGGYLNKSGEFKGLFTPYSGEESNSTIFITSPIWSNPENYIQTKVIKDKIISIFLLSDGMEKITFECSSLIDNVFIDVNVPYKNFFFPILLKIKTLEKEDEYKLKDEWKVFMESGNDEIKNEVDDKTLLISLLK